MIITFAKPILNDNIISVTNKKIDNIMETSKLDASNYYISEANLPWIDKTLIIADFHIRKTLLHLLNKETSHPNSSTLVYNITLSHPMQQAIIPQQIEEILIEYVSQSWIMNKTSNSQLAISDLFTDLKSISLISTSKTQKSYYII